MADWIPKEEFEKTEYGKLNLRLDPRKYFAVRTVKRHGVYTPRAALPVKRGKEEHDA